VTYDHGERERVGNEYFCKKMDVHG
jgi:hypothetical protein